MSALKVVILFAFTFVFNNTFSQSCKSPEALVADTLPPVEDSILISGGITDIISDIDISEEFYDASKEYRQDAMSGKLNSGEIINDPFSVDRVSIH